MSLDTNSPRSDVVSGRAGTTTLVLGVLFLAATVVLYVLSLSEAFNPPHWVRVVGLVGLPIGFVGTPVAYMLARTGPGRDRGRIGVAIALAGLVAFVVLMFTVG